MLKLEKIKRNKDGSRSCKEFLCQQTYLGGTAPESPQLLFHIHLNKT